MGMPENMRCENSAGEHRTIKLPVIMLMITDLANTCFQCQKEIWPCAVWKKSVPH